MMSKLFNDSLFDDFPTVPAVVNKTVNNPSKYAGKYPYFGEMYTSVDIEDLMPFISDKGVFDEVWMALSGRKYRYPLTKTGDNSVGSGLQDKAFSSKINANKTSLSILDKLWVDRQERFQEYLDVTYKTSGATSGTSLGTAISTSEGVLYHSTNVVGVNLGTSTNDSNTLFNSNTDGTTSGESSSNGKSSNTTDSTDETIGTNNSTSTGDSSSSSDSKTSTSNQGTTNSKSANINSVMPEASGLEGMYNPGIGINPGTLGLNYISDGNDSSIKGSSDDSGESTTKASASGKSSDKTDSHSKSNSKGNSTSIGTSSDVSTNSGKYTTMNSGDSETHSTGATTVDSSSDSHSNVDTTNTVDSETTNNTVGENNSEGRMKDLITLSKEFQSLSQRESLVEAIVKTMSECLSLSIDTIDVESGYMTIDSFTGEWKW